MKTRVINAAELEAFIRASNEIGKWIAAMLDDPHCCREFKEDAHAWFDALLEIRTRQIPGDAANDDIRP